MKNRTLYLGGVLLISTFLLAGCNFGSRAPKADDNTIANDIQARLFQDSILKNRDIRVTVQSGTVVLSGLVESEAERNAVGQLAGQVQGVKHVVNQLMLGGTAAVPTRSVEMASTPPAVAPPAKPKATPQPASRRESAQSRAPIPPSAEGLPPQGAASALPNAAQAMAPSTVPPPEPVTIPAGTVVSVRMIDAVDSEVNKAGEEFAATLDAPLVVGDRVVVPKGSDVRVRLVQAESAGRMTGRSELQLEMVSIKVGSQTYPVATGVYQVQGASRGKRTAATVGGGAALGALIGGVIGKGKGAAVGAAVGAGSGTAVQVATKGQQVHVDSEAKIDFVLKEPLNLNL